MSHHATYQIPANDDGGGDDGFHVSERSLALIMAVGALLAAFGFISPHKRIEKVEETQEKLADTVAEHTTKIAVMSSDVAYIRQRLDERWGRRAGRPQ